MIELHRLHGNGTFLVNPDLIEIVEARPDTTITMVNRHHYVVADSVDDVVGRIIEFRARVASAAGAPGDHAAGARSLAAIDQNDQEQAA
ncbi:MAG: flagellar FlbD family protein [Thermoleophilia bacterium]|nr:flagellar FlbD family protein [Thermoleophilia bacterium]